MYVCSMGIRGFDGLLHLSVHCFNDNEMLHESADDLMDLADLFQSHMAAHNIGDR